MRLSCFVPAQKDRDKIQTFPGLLVRAIAGRAA